MGALPIPEPYPHALYIEELHQFFTAKGVAFGSPADLVPLVERLGDPGLFHENLRSLVRSILVRERGGVSRSDLLAILSVAVGGPLIYRSAQQLRQPLSRLLAFVDGVLRKLPAQPNLATAGRPVLVPRVDLLKFPGSGAGAHQGASASSRPRVWSTARSALRSMRPAVGPSPSFRTAMLYAGGVLLLLVLLALLALLLRPSHTSPRATTAPGGSLNVRRPASGEGFFGSLNSFLRSQEPASMKGAPVIVAPAPADSLNGSSSNFPVTGDTEPVTLGGPPQPGSLRESQPARVPSSTSLRLTPEFSQPAPKGVVPAGASNTPPPGVVPTTPQSAPH